MAELKTQPTDGDVAAFPDERRRTDARAICALMSELSGEPPVIWGTGLVGFGSYAYTYASGRSGEWFAVGFAPRKQSLTLYIMDGSGDYEALLARLGPHKTGKSCLLVNRLEVDTPLRSGAAGRRCFSPTLLSRGAGKCWPTAGNCQHFDEEGCARTALRERGRGRR